VQNALIFCNRKVEVDVLNKSLLRHKFSVGALHGDMAQTVRFTTLERFKAGELKLLVCSDVAARGLDIDGLSHVFNFDVPHHAEDYVHRIGRTGRAGLAGEAFTIASPEDRYNVEAIEKLTGHPIPPIVVEGLDPVDWAEDGGRKRGRGRGKAAAKAPAAKVPAAKAPPAPKVTKAPAAKPKAAKERAPKAEAPPPAVPAPLAAAPARPARAPSVRDRAPRRGEHRQPDRMRDSDEPDRPVTGFGVDIPAFMLLAKSRAPVQETEVEPQQESEP
jgi:superfamily II DNA/RNA helicase